MIYFSNLHNLQDNSQQSIYPSLAEKPYLYPTQLPSAEQVPTAPSSPHRQPRLNWHVIPTSVVPASPIQEEQSSKSTTEKTEKVAEQVVSCKEETKEKKSLLSGILSHFWGSSASASKPVAEAPGNVKINLAEQLFKEQLTQNSDSLPDRMLQYALHMKHLGEARVPRDQLQTLKKALFDAELGNIEINYTLVEQIPKGLQAIQQLAKWVRKNKLEFQKKYINETLGDKELLQEEIKHLGALLSMSNPPQNPEFLKQKQKILLYALKTLNTESSYKLNNKRPIRKVN